MNAVVEDFIMYLYSACSQRSRMFRQAAIHIIPLITSQKVITLLEEKYATHHLPMANKKLSDQRAPENDPISKYEQLRCVLSDSVSQSEEGLHSDVE